MDKDKIVIIICGILIVVLLGAILWVTFGGKNTQVNDVKTNTNIVQSNEKNIINNTNEANSNSTKSNETTNETENQTKNNTPSQSQGNSNVQGREETESTINTDEQTDEEKVIDLAKAKWGTSDSSITVNIENRDGNIYMVSVRDTNTTAALAWYKVDLSNGEVTQQ